MRKILQILTTSLSHVKKVTEEAEPEAGEREEELKCAHIEEPVLVAVTDKLLINMEDIRLAGEDDVSLTSVLIGQPEFY